MWREAVGAWSSRSSQIEQRIAMRFEYPVVFTQEMFDPRNETLVELVTRDTERHARFFVVIDDGVDSGNPGLRRSIARYFEAHAGSIQLGGEPLVITGGERAKNDAAVVNQVLERLFALGFDRHAYLLAVGGGAVLDALGYAASLFHRGLRLIRVPTTVLAQDDAGVGVKNGINAFGAKNALGTFSPPFAVVNDFSLLASLSERDHIAGIAEAIKVALIRDADFFGWIEENADALRAREPAATQVLIRRCAELHLMHIRDGGDPFETGSARPLDFGHWAAHKLEVLTEHALRHGEAVAIGMVLDTHYACSVGMLDVATAERVERVVAAVGLPTYDTALARRDADGCSAVMRGLEEFREHLGGRLTVTLLAEVGRGVEVHEIDHARMQAIIDVLATR
ncbi:MAG: 3-dehydroquinate synthase [Polyangiales bacterium]